MSRRCDYSEDRRYMIILLFFSVFLGTAVTLSLNVVFAYKWHSQLTQEFRQSPLALLSATTITFLTVERVLRALELILWYEGSGIGILLIYLLNNLVSSVGIFATLFALLSLKMKIAFRRSKFQVPKKEMLSLYLLISFTIVSLNCFLVLSVVPSIKSHPYGRLFLVGFAFVIFVSGLTLIWKLHSGFSSRIRSLVVNKLNHCSSIDRTPSHYGSSPPTTPTATTMTNSTMSLASMTHKWSKQSNENPLPSVTFTQLTPKNSSNGSVVAVTSSSLMRKSSSLAGLRKSSLNRYEHGYQEMLKIAVKSLVLTIWIGVSFAFLGAVGPLMSFGQCADWFNVSANLCIIVTFVIIALSITMSLPHSERDYEECWCCNTCDQMVQKVVAFQVDVEVEQTATENE